SFRSATFSPDGKKLAASMGSALQLWDITTGQEIYTLSTDFEVRGWRCCPVVFSPNGRLLAAPGKDNTVGLWETATGQLFGQLSGPKPQEKGDQPSVRFLVFSPDSTMLATSSNEDDKIHLWEVASGKEISQLGGKPIQYGLNGWPLAFSPDGRILATIRDNME